MPELSRKFLAEIARRYELDEIDRETSSVAAVAPHGRIAWVNQGWLAFASANGVAHGRIAPPVSYFDAIDGELRPWFEHVMARALETGKVFEHDYDCSTATIKRTFRMRVYPIDDLGVLVVHRLRAERRQAGGVDRVRVADYRDAKRLIVMCSHCRHTRRSDDEKTWDWIPGWVSRPPARVSHGLCPVCAHYYYPAR